MNLSDKRGKTFNWLRFTRREQVSAIKCRCLERCEADKSQCQRWRVNVEKCREGKEEEKRRRERLSRF
jgi:hypothetical protein